MAIDTASVKKRLEAELVELTTELESIGIKNPEVESDWVERGNDLNTPEPDLIDVADRVEDYNERRATLALLETRYNNIGRALKKIETSDFGFCEICSESIEEDRIDANAAARTCKAHIDDEEKLSK